MTTSFSGTHALHHSHLVSTIANPPYMMHLGNPGLDRRLGRQTPRASSTTTSNCTSHRTGRPPLQLFALAGAIRKAARPRPVKGWPVGPRRRRLPLDGPKREGRYNGANPQGRKIPLSLSFRCAGAGAKGASVPVARPPGAPASISRGRTFARGLRSGRSGVGVPVRPFDGVFLRAWLSTGRGVRFPWPGGEAAGRPTEAYRAGCEFSPGGGGCGDLDVSERHIVL